MKKIITTLLLILISFGIDGCDSGMDSIYAQVINDSVNQYNIAKRQGDPIQICVQAGMVSASYLQANDEYNYGIWKKTEKEDCAKAGIK